MNVCERMGPVWADPNYRRKIRIHANKRGKKTGELTQLRYCMASNGDGTYRETSRNLVLYPGEVYDATICTDEDGNRMFAIARQFGTFFALITQDSYYDLLETQSKKHTCYFEVI